MASVPTTFVMTANGSNTVITNKFAFTDGLMGGKAISDIVANRFLGCPTFTLNPAAMPTVTANATLTPAQCLNYIVVVNATVGLGNVTLTLPSASTMCAAIASCTTGCSWELNVINSGARTCAVAAGTGITLAMSSTTIANATSRRIIFCVTDAANGLITAYS